MSSAEIIVFFSGKLSSLSPIHLISKLSEAKERPKPDNKIYSALAGPSANKSAFFYEYVLTPENKVLRKEFECEMRKMWRKVEPLYLYHGERYCVDVENNEENDPDIFNDSEDGSKQMYQEQMSRFERNNSEEGLKSFLREIMGTEDLHYLTKKLFC